MDITFVQFAITLFIAIVFGIAYAALNYLTSTKPGTFNVGRLIASVIFGIFIGIYTVYSGGTLETIDWTIIGTAFFGFQGLLMWINSIVDWIWVQATGHKVLEQTFVK